MKGFILLSMQGGLNRLIALSSIKEVRQLANGRAAIVTNENKHKVFGFETTVDFWDVIDKIKEAVE